MASPYFLLIGVLIASSTGDYTILFDDVTYILSTAVPANAMYTCTQSSTPLYNSEHYAPLGAYDDLEGMNICTYNPVVIWQLRNTDLVSLNSMDGLNVTSALLRLEITPIMSLGDFENCVLLFRGLVSPVNITTVTEISSGIDENPPDFDFATYVVSMPISEAYTGNTPSTSRFLIPISTELIQLWLSGAPPMISITFIQTVDQYTLADPLGLNFIALSTTEPDSITTTTPLVQESPTVTSTTSTAATVASTTSTAATVTSTLSTVASTAGTVATVETTTTTTTTASGKSALSPAVLASIGVVSALTGALAIYAAVHFTNLRHAHHAYQRLEDHTHKKHHTRI